MYVSVTESDWYEFLKTEKCDEVNFWRPVSYVFKALELRVIANRAYKWFLENDFTSKSDEEGVMEVYYSEEDE